MSDPVRPYPRASTESLERIHARMASPNAVESPMTGMRAAVIRWAFFTGIQRGSDGRSPGPAMRYEPVASGLLGHELLLESPRGAIAVDLARVALRFDSRGDGGTPVYGSIPPVFRGVLAEKPLGRGMLYYREQFLHHGDPVAITARLVPVPDGGPFRGPGLIGARYRATGEGDDGKVLVEDLTLRT